MKWKIEYSKKAIRDLERLDNTQKKIVISTVLKTSLNPLPFYEGGYGKPLGNKNGYNLTGYYKIKIKKAGLRVIYRLIRENNVFRIVVVGLRDEMDAYKEAHKRKINNED